MTRSYGNRVRTVADRKNEMTRFLYFATDAALQAVTIDDLQRRYGVTAQVAEYELIVARNKRGVAAHG